MRRMAPEQDDEEEMSFKMEEQVELPHFTTSVRINPKDIVNEMRKNSHERAFQMESEKLDDQRQEEQEEEKSHEFVNQKIGFRKVLDIKAFDGMKFQDFLEHNQKIKIKIVNTTMHNSESYFGYGAFITYHIHSQFSPSEVYEADRRFKDFDWLNSYLRSQRNYKGFVFPHLPEKKSLGSTDPIFINQRKGELESYLKALASHPILSQDDVLRIFLGDCERGSFESTKENNSLSGGALAELDWSKMKENYEYAKASMKTKWGGEEPRFDWKEVKPKIEEVLRIDEVNNRLLKTIQQKEILYKAKEQIDSQLNVLSVKIANNMKDNLDPVRMLAKLFMRETEYNLNEKVIVEHFGNQVRFLKGKLDGFKESNELLMKIFHEILTYQELLRVKHGKTFEYMAHNEQNKYEMADKDVKQIHNKLQELYSDAETVRDNLSHEADILKAEFDIFLPDQLHQYYEKHAELYQNAFRNKYESEEE